ncbi:MAG: hypothetical protein ACOX1T_03050 [Saccharofermentanales bacterium]
MGKVAGELSVTVCPVVVSDGATLAVAVVSVDESPDICASFIAQAVSEKSRQTLKIAAISFKRNKQVILLQKNNSSAASWQLAQSKGNRIGCNFCNLFYFGRVVNFSQLKVSNSFTFLCLFAKLEASFNN